MATSQRRSGVTGPTTGSKANLLFANYYRRAGAPYRGSGLFDLELFRLFRLSVILGLVLCRGRRGHGRGC